MNLDNVKIAVIGLGYVGLPLAVEFGKKYRVVGFDIDEKRIKELSEGFDRTKETVKEEFEKAQLLNFSLYKEDIKDCNIFIITVPTPIDEYKKPDLNPLLSASKTVGSVLKKGDLVIYESTVYPGCTEDDCVPVLERFSNLKYNKDFFCGYSPERINPGDKVRTLTKILKITSGSTPQIADFVDKLYQSIISAGTYLAPSMRVAEAAKAVENSQRYVNISFINEITMLLDKIGVNPKEVFDATKTKWNFHDYQSGLIGGPCLEASVSYLSYKAIELFFLPQILKSSQKTNNEMVDFVVYKSTIELKKNAA